MDENTNLIDILLEDEEQNNEEQEESDGFSEGGEDDPGDDSVNLHRTFDENGTLKPFKSVFECNEITTMMDVSDNNTLNENLYGLMSIIAVDSVTGAVTLNKGELYCTFALKFQESTDNLHLNAMHVSGFLSAFPNNELPKQFV